MAATALGEAVAGLSAALDVLLAVRLEAVPAPELMHAFGCVERGRNRLAAFDQRLIGGLASSGAVLESGAVSLPDLVTSLARCSRRTARARVGRAVDLGPRQAVSGEPLEPIHPVTAAAVQSGEVSEEQSQVIVSTLGRIGPDAEPDAFEIAERFLVEAARVQPPEALRTSGEWILAHVDPSGREPAEDALERARDFTLVDARDAEGGVLARGRLTAECGAVLRAIFDALAAPRPANDLGETDPRTAGQRRHDALLELALRVLRSGDLPDSGGVPASVIVQLRGYGFGGAGIGDDVVGDDGTGAGVDGADADRTDSADRVGATADGFAADGFALGGFDCDGTAADGTDADGTGAGDTGADGTDADGTGAGDTGAGGTGADGTGSTGSVGASTHDTDTGSDGDSGGADSAATGTDGGGAFGESLLARLSGMGWFGTGQPVTLDRLRPLLDACEVTTVVLSATGEVLDYGRERRFASSPQRRALTARDGGCCFPGCDRPPAWTEAHHVIEWLDLGVTSIDNMCLLCSYHHRNFRRAGWQVIMRNGVPFWRPPAWLDPHRRLIRNTARHVPRIDFDVTVGAPMRT